MNQKKKFAKTSGRKPEDLRKKYPVDKILSLLETSSMGEIAKQFNVAKSLVAKIVRRYGSDELKKTVSKRGLKKTKPILNEENQENNFNDLDQYMTDLENHYTLLQTPTLNLAKLDENLTRVVTRLEYMQTSGAEIIKLIEKELHEKEEKFQPKQLTAMIAILKKYCKHSLAADRVIISTCREQSNIQEKYVKLESISRDLKDVKTLIQIFFDSFNALDEKNYKKVKKFILNAAPPTEAYFYQFEQSYRDYKEKLLNEYKLQAQLDKSNLQVD